MLSKSYRIPTIPMKTDCAKKPSKPIKITQREVDELNERIRKEAEENHRRRLSPKTIQATLVINRNSD